MSQTQAEMLIEIADLVADTPVSVAAEWSVAMKSSCGVP